MPSVTGPAQACAFYALPSYAVRHPARVYRDSANAGHSRYLPVSRLETVRHAFLTRPRGTLNGDTSFAARRCSRRFIAGPKRTAALASLGGEEEAEAEAEAEVACNVATVWYHRPDGEYAGWVLHVWGPGALSPTPWQEGLEPLEVTSYGARYSVPLQDAAEEISFLVHKGDDQEPSGQLAVRDHAEAWLIAGKKQVWLGEAPEPATIPEGDLSTASAHWLSPGCVAVPALRAPPSPTTPLTYTMFASPVAGMALTSTPHQGVEGAAEVVPLAEEEGGLPEELCAKFPHLAGYTCLRVPEEARTEAALTKYVQCQLAVAVHEQASGKMVDATGVQLPGVLDAAFKYDGPLGAAFDEEAPGAVTLRVWAPTARSVHLLLFESAAADAPAQRVAMRRGAGAEAGLWAAASGEGASWQGMYYNYEVEVFCPWTMRVERSVATDPYSRSLSVNGLRTHIADVRDPALRPAGWGERELPALGADTDASVYELHVRDFSAHAEDVPEELRGTFGAFAVETSAGVRHLRALAEAGLTHVHLLPVYDFGTVNEDRAQWKDPEAVAGAPLRSFGPASEAQQAAVFAVANEDAYNWGYDPVHFGVADGSYCEAAEGAGRVLEFRRMVQALGRLGLRLVMDVVYNHTYGLGPHGPHSVLDKIVPGYYHRRSAAGAVENSTCMNNTASEHAMMERLVVDDLVHWAANMGVRAFRFDLMGHLMLSTLQAAKAALAEAVPGEDIYLYGEGWDFGEVAGNQRGVTGAQLNLAGTGIGSFNDRLREGAVGGSPFGDPRQQGFVTGLYVAPNGTLDQGPPEEQKRRLLEDTEKVKVGMAGNLRDYAFVDRSGSTRLGKDAGYDGSNCGYAGQPSETVNYVSAHDNETLYDMITWKVGPGVAMEDRVRLNWAATSLVAYAQGVPFFHAGDELLRSKSLDRDSYNSGDWFNRLDFTAETHNFGVGLPGQEKNGDKWDLMRPMLADPELKVSPAMIRASIEHFKTALAVRASSKLFRLSSLEEVQQRVKFYNTGPDQEPGVIVMCIRDLDGGCHVDAEYRAMVVVVNATPQFYTESGVDFQFDFAGRTLELHPLLAAQAYDERVKQCIVTPKAIAVPSYTTAVFVEKR